MATKQFLGGRVIHGTGFAGYKYKVFNPGTSTLKTTYKDSSLTVGNENASTITLDANGAGQIWFSGNADVTFYDSNLVVIYTDNNVNLDSTSTSTGNSNLTLNNSFEDDATGDGIPDNWTNTLYTGGTFTLDTADSFNGAKCIKYVSVGTGGGYLVSDSFFAVSPSISYTIGFALKGTVDVRNVVEVLWYKLNQTASATPTSTIYDNSTTNPTSWTEQWNPVTSPSDAAFAKIRLTGCHSSDATSGTTRFDQVIFTDALLTRAPHTTAETHSGAETFTQLAMLGLLDASNASAGQIKFPATQNASSNVNTLDDYEEGTWTPSFGGNTTYTSQFGTYTKIGRLVSITVYVQINVIGTGSTVSITGLPFTTAASVRHSFCLANVLTLTLSVVSVHADAAASSTTISFLSKTVAAISDQSNSIFGNGSEFALSGTYYV